MAAHQVTKALHQHPTAENIGQFSQILAVGNGLLKRLGEIGAHQKGKIGIVTPEIGNLFEDVVMKAKAIDISAGGMLLLLKLDFFIPNETIINLEILKEGAQKSLDIIFKSRNAISLNSKVFLRKGKKNAADGGCNTTFYTLACFL